MDDVSIQGEELERTLFEIERINRFFGGYPPTIDGVASLVRPDDRKLSVLDVGTGGADYPKRLVEWGQKRGIEVEVVGIDLTPTTVEYATRRTEGYPIRVELMDLFDLDEARQFDVVHAAAVLHHFPGDSAVRALARMARHARRGVVVNDLHRHAAAWFGIRLYTRAVVKNRLVRYDAPLSVLRGFSRTELEAMCESASLAAPRIRWRALFRWEMVIPSEGSAGSRAR